MTTLYYIGQKIQQLRQDSNREIEKLWAYVQNLNAELAIGNKTEELAAKVQGIVSMILYHVKWHQLQESAVLKVNY